MAALNRASAQALLAFGITPLGLPEVERYARLAVEPAAPVGVQELGLRSEPNLELLASLAPDLLVLGEDLAGLQPRLFVLTMARGSSPRPCGIGSQPSARKLHSSNREHELVRRNEAADLRGGPAWLPSSPGNGTPIGISRSLLAIWRHEYRGGMFVTPVFGGSFMLLVMKSAPLAPADRPSSDRDDIGIALLARANVSIAGGVWTGTAG